MKKRSLFAKLQLDNYGSFLWPDRPAGFSCSKAALSVLSGHAVWENNCCSKFKRSPAGQHYSSIFVFGGVIHAPPRGFRCQEKTKNGFNSCICSLVEYILCQTETSVWTG